MPVMHNSHALRAPAVSLMPHQVEESEAVGGPSLRLSDTGSPAGSDSPNGASGARSIPPDRAPCFLGPDSCAEFVDHANNLVHESSRLRGEHADAPMTFAVTIRQHDNPIAVEPGGTILEAALALGVPYPHGCLLYTSPSPRD